MKDPANPFEPRQSKNGKSRIAIFDDTGRIVYRAYVANAETGLRGADLEGCVAMGAQLQGQDLSDCCLYAAVLSFSDLSFATLSGADLRGAVLDFANCKSTVFASADLGADSTNKPASLLGADLTDAVLDGANLRGARYNSRTRFPPGIDPEQRGMVFAADSGTTGNRD